MSKNLRFSTIIYIEEFRRNESVEIPPGIQGFGRETPQNQPFILPQAITFDSFTVQGRGFIPALAFLYQKTTGGAGGSKKL